MKNANIVVMYGGGGKEHDISVLSSNYLITSLSSLGKFNIKCLNMNENGDFIDKDNQIVFLGPKQNLYIHKDNQCTDLGKKIDYIIPCFHGTPGETGEIQAILDLQKIPYLGCDMESSVLSFNKISTKLWLENIGVPTTPFSFLLKGQKDNKKKALDFFKAHGDIFIKAASEGSAIGVYHCTSENDLMEYINQAFSFSKQVLLEKTNIGRELELSCFEYKGEIIVTKPGEILCEDDFYDYEQKYNSTSTTKTDIIAKNISDHLVEKIRSYALSAFKVLGLKDLSRIDFFLNDNGEIYLNEINTFPGMTPISMFPKMMENHGIKFSDFLNDRISNALKED